MSLFFKLSSSDNCVLVTKRLLKLLHVKVALDIIKSKILEHPNHPSLLSISDAFESWNIKTLAVKVTYEQILNSKVACIAQIKKE